MSSIKEEFSFDELKAENKRLENELIFANKCLDVLNKIRENLFQIFSIGIKSKMIFTEEVVENFKDLDKEYKNLWIEKLQLIPNINITENSHPLNVSTKQSIDSKTKQIITKPTEVQTKEAVILDMRQPVKSTPNKYIVLPIIKKPVVKPVIKRVVKIEVKPSVKTSESENKSIDNQNVSTKQTQKQQNMGSNERCYNCPKCTRTFLSEFILQTHLKIYHRKLGPIECPVCHKLIKDHDLRRHIYTHSRPEIHCEREECSFKTKLPSKMTKHMKTTHSTEKKYVCDLPDCGKRLKSYTGLSLHKKIHSNEKPFVCEWPGCEYRCVMAQALKMHLRTHTKEKPCICFWPGCEYRSRTPSQLIEHRYRVHEPHKEKYKYKKAPTERNYVCDWPECGRRYNRNTTLTAHMKTHTNEPLVCEWKDCEYRCHTTFKMKLHLRSHTKEKPYSCEYSGCKYRCALPSNLRRHQRVHGLNPSPKELTVCLK